MRIRDLLESVDDDKNIIKASAQIFIFIKDFMKRHGKLKDREKLHKFDTELGEIIDFDFPKLDWLGIYMKADNAMRTGPNKTLQLKGYFSKNLKGIVLNYDLFLNNDTGLESTIAHELRHALDYELHLNKLNPTKDFSTKRYNTPRKKEHRKSDYTRYLAKPSEINARFTQVLHAISTSVLMHTSFKNTEVFKGEYTKVVKYFFNKYRITELFPEGTASRDYKRLLNRAYKFIEDKASSLESKGI